MTEKENERGKEFIHTEIPHLRNQVMLVTRTFFGQ